MPYHISISLLAGLYSRRQCHCVSRAQTRRHGDVHSIFPDALSFASPSSRLRCTFQPFISSFRACIGTSTKGKIHLFARSAKLRKHLFEDRIARPKYTAVPMPANSVISAYSADIRSPAVLQYSDPSIGPKESFADSEEHSLGDQRPKAHTCS